MKRATNKRAKDTRPTMDRMEVEMRVAHAGHEAVQKASKEGASPKLTKALARGARKDQVGGLLIGAASLSSMVSLERYWSTALAGQAGPSTALAYTAFAYLRADEALAALDADEAAFAKAAVEFSKEIPLDSLREISAAIQGHIKDLFATDNAGGAADAGALPGESAQAATEKSSPSKNGLKK